MRLADYQIDAIITEMRKPFDAEQKALKEKIKAKAMPGIQRKAKAIAAAFRYIPAGYLKFLSTSDYYDPKKPTTKSVEKRLLKEIDYSAAKEFNVKEAKQKIVVKSIACNTIQELADALGVKF